MLYGPHDGAQPREAYDGGQHEVDGGHLHEVGHGGGTGKDFDVVRGQSVLHFGILAFVGYGYGVGCEFQGLPDEQVGIAAGTEHFDSKEVAVTTDDIEGLCSDGARGTEYGDMFHFFFFLDFLRSVFVLSISSRNRESALECR